MVIKEKCVHHSYRKAVGQCQTSYLAATQTQQDRTRAGSQAARGKAGTAAAVEKATVHRGPEEKRRAK